MFHLLFCRYPSGDIAVTAGSIGLIVTVVLSYPLLVHPTRSSLLYIYFAFIRPPPEDDEDEGVVVVSSRKNSMAGDEKTAVMFKYSKLTAFAGFMSVTEARFGFSTTVVLLQQAGFDADSDAGMGLERHDSFNGKDALDDSYNVLVSPVSPLPDDELEDE